ncbi:MULTISPECIES: hypothetical protein [unclassified Microcystis]|uniref:hypothetical protein n=1 Tax=unclassified Microcystis TaxID=2643300 RepID=UPI0025883BD8|nr:MULTISPECIES: hypothetical protein [unclassified Microcystis]
MVRSPKSIAGAVGATLGNAPYKIGDRAWADVLNRAGIGMEVMHERNAHNFPLDLASGEQAPVALIAPAING